jgi:cytochrome bd-type quinol oxidase subunit 1
MNFPYWELGWAGGGLLIAIIATFHVFISHFAVGGGLWLVLSEQRARKTNDLAMLDYVKTHTRFFLLVTMVAGALSGVGIWLVISVYNPQATSFLIHTFVMGWATEWVCFLVEIASLFIYYYTFDKMDAGKHILIGWIYFISAWLSLFLINGIIGFMFTPGAWLETKSFWDGFFNPSFWPSLAFRSFLALMLAGIYGLITSSRLKDDDLRQRTTRWNAVWLAAPVVLVLLTGWGYLSVLPELHQQFIQGGSPEIPPFFNAFLYITPVLIILGVALFVKMPRRVQQGVSVLLMVLGFMYISSFEYVREAGRRPYIVGGYMYSNGVKVDEVAKVQKAGILNTAKWVQIKQINPGNQMAAGRELFNLTCLPCHSVGGPLNDINLRVAKYQTVFAMESFISGMGKINKYMPPWPGNSVEKTALAGYITKNLGQKKNQN